VVFSVQRRLRRRALIAYRASGRELIAKNILRLIFRNALVRQSRCCLKARNGSKFTAIVHAKEKRDAAAPSHLHTRDRSGRVARVSFMEYYHQRLCDESISGEHRLPVLSVNYRLGSITGAPFARPAIFWRGASEYRRGPSGAKFFAKRSTTLIGSGSASGADPTRFLTAMGRARTRTFSKPASISTAYTLGNFFCQLG